MEQPATGAATPPAPATSLLDQYEIESDHSEAPSVVAAAEGQLESAPTAPAPHPRHLIQMAQDLGFSAEEIKDSSTSELGRAVYHANRVLQHTARDAQRTAAQEQARGNPPPSPQGSENTPAGQSATAEEGLDLGINEADFAPEIVGAFKKVAGNVATLRAELKAVKEELAGYRQREQVREVETLSDRIDRHFSRHETLLGKGKGREMDANSPEYGRRMAILSLVDRDTSRTDLEAKIDRAVGILFGGAAGLTKTGEAAPLTAPPPSAKNTKRPQRPDGTFMSDAEIAWANASLARPTQRTGSAEPNGVKKAEKAVASQLREYQNEPGAEPDLGEEFPE